MRDASGREAGAQRLSAAATEKEFEDKTTAVSVATLRSLAERSTKETAESPNERPDPSLATPPPSPPTFFEKSGAILVVAEPESERRSSKRDALRTEPPLVSGIPPARPKVGSLAAILQSASARARELTQKRRASARSSAGRWLVVCACALLAVVVVGKVRGWNVGEVRERVAASAPAVRALMDWGRALLPQ